MAEGLTCGAENLTDFYAPNGRRW